MKGQKMKVFLSRNTIVPIFVVFFLIFSIAVQNFMTGTTWATIINANAYKGIMAIGMTFVIINGYFDMSICTSMALTAAIACKTQPTFGVGGAILAALLVGAAIGAFNGFMVANMKINAFVVTLATMLGCRGLELIYCDNRAIASEAFRIWGAKMIGPFSWVTILFIILLLLAAYMLRYSKHGRNTYAAGGNALSAFNSGINVEKTTFINFLICGFTGGLGGVVCAMQQGASDPALGWPDTHMLVIAGVVLGGTKLTGGVGNMWYTLGGVILLGMIDKVMSLMNVPISGVKITTGLIMILVLLLDHFIKPATYVSEPESEPAADK